MAQVLAIICDRHLESGEEVTAESSYVISVAPVSPGELKVLDLCDKCAVELLGDLRGLMDYRGRAYNGPHQTAADSEDYSCPRCDFVALSKGGLSQHAGSSHHTTYAALVGQEPDLGMLICPDPECDYRSASRAGLMTHAKKHGRTLRVLEDSHGPVMHEAERTERRFAEEAAKVDGRTLMKGSVRDGRAHCRECDKDIGPATPGHKWYCDDCRTPKQDADARRKKQQRDARKGKTK